MRYFILTLTSIAFNAKILFTPKFGEFVGNILDVPKAIFLTWCHLKNSSRHLVRSRGLKWNTNRSIAPLVKQFKMLQCRVRKSFPYILQTLQLIGTAIATQIRLRLPSYGPKHAIYTFYSQILYLICHCIEKNTKIKKQAGFGPYFKKHYSLLCWSLRSFASFNLRAWWQLLFLFIHSKWFIHFRGLLPCRHSTRAIPTAARIPAPEDDPRCVSGPRQG